MTILLVNFLIYVVWFFFTLKKRKWKFDVVCLALSFYVIIAFLGYYTYACGIYQNTFGYGDVTRLSIYPYFFSWICTFIFFIPLRIKINDSAMLAVDRCAGFLSKVSLILFCVFLMQAFFSLTNVNVNTLDYADAYNDAASGTGKSFKDPIVAFIFSKMILLARLGLPFFYTFQCLLLVRTKKFKYMVMIFVVYFLSLIPQIVTANRGGMFFSTANVLFFIVLFWPLMSIKQKKAIAILTVSVFAIMSSFAIAISNARFDRIKSTSGTEQILRYFGEAYPNLGFNIWGKNINHPYGLRMFPNAVNVLSKKDFLRYLKGGGRNRSFYFWERYVGIPMKNFKTLFGDLYIEFNFVGVWCAAFGWLLFLCFLKSKSGLIGKVVLTFFAYQTCIWGLFGSNFSEQYLLTLMGEIMILCLWKKFGFGMIEREDKKVLI